MERQLVLLEQEPDWHLDEHTREVGRAGLAQAREAMRAAAQRRSSTTPGRPATSGRTAA